MAAALGTVTGGGGGVSVPPGRPPGRGGPRAGRARVILDPRGAHVEPGQMVADFDAKLPKPAAGWRADRGRGQRGWAAGVQDPGRGVGAPGCVVTIRELRFSLNPRNS